MTGASGFVGRHVVRHLAGLGADIRPLSRIASADPSARVLPPPDAPADVFRRAVSGLDAVVHCAALNNDGSPRRLDLFAANAGLTARIATAARDEGVGRFLYVSSIRAVAPAGATVAIGDDTPAVPGDDYGRSKREGEIAALDAAAGAFRPVVLRLPPVYGHGMGGNLGLLLRLARLPLPLPLAGLGAPRSLVSGEAAGRAVGTLLAAARPARTTYVASDLAPATPAGIVRAFRRGYGLAPRLFAVHPVLLRAAAAMAGRGDAWAGLLAEQTCDPSSLVAEGWAPDADSLAGLEAVAAGLRAG